MRRFLPVVLFASLILPATASGQDETPDGTETPVTLPTGLPVKLDISRRSLKNFLTDETALLPYRTADDTVLEFQGAFTLGSPSAPFAPIWDPQSCRLVGVLDLKKSRESPAYALLATGQQPTATISGANGAPVYFGMRLDRGRPEFLYTHGAHAIAEMIWLEDDGSVMKQRFSFRKPLKSVRLTIPGNWVPMITPSLGEFSGNVLEVSGGEISEITLLYRLTQESGQQIEEVSESE